MPNLLIFVDGLPYYYLEHTRFLKTLAYKRSITPGIGFSVNIKPEMYSGLCADDIGYFCEYGLSSMAPRLWEQAVSILHPVRRWPRVDRVLHKALIRAHFDVLNIPFAYIKYFARTSGSSVYSPDFPHASLFNEAEVKVLAAELMQRGSISRDLQVFERACASVGQNQDLYLSFVGLDEAGHIHGVGTTSYDETLSQLESWIEELSEQFCREYPEGNVIIFSDHGMVNVTQTTDIIHLEKELGPSNRKSYVYFLDSVMMRIWFFDEALAERAARLLREMGEGTILDSAMRKAYGVTQPFCGDLIYVLDEGKVFSPNYFGLKEPVAMHGYLPTVDSQQAVLLASGPDVSRRFDETTRTIDLYPYLLDLVAV